MNKSLDFSPQKPLPPIFPLFTWQGKALNHFQTETQPQVQIEEKDLSHLNLATAMKSLYSDLTFIELARFYTKASQMLSVDSRDWEETFKSYGYKFDERLLQVIRLFMGLPVNFQGWATVRQLSPKDLAPLLSLSKDKYPSESLDLIFELNLSRSQGCQILELLVDLVLIETNEMALTPEKKTFESWLKQLKQQRYPMTAGRDSQAMKQLEQLPWPKSIKTKWVRKGDSSGLQVNFDVTSATDLELKIQSLQRVADGWKKND